MPEVVRCPECKSRDIRFRFGSAANLTMNPPIQQEDAYCVACGCEWTQYGQIQSDTSDYNPNKPRTKELLLNRWQRVTKHGKKHAGTADA